MIRQAEMQAVLHDLAAASGRLLGFRRRMLAGAAVEGGALALEFEVPGALKPEEYYSNEWGGIEGYGLVLDRVVD